MGKFLASLLITSLILPLMAENERFTILYADDAQRTFLEKSLAALPAQDWQWMKLEERNTQALTLARSYKVQVTPTLLIVNKEGKHQKLRGDNITPASYELALSKLPESDAPDERTLLLAQLAEQRALSSDRMTSEEQLTESVTQCYAALSQDCLTDDDKQLIALRLLYPLLMRQYTRAYNARGAHTPDNEAKLLEAVKAVELARDINPNSVLGREAFTHRDELRKARVKARAYE